MVWGQTVQGQTVFRHVFGTAACYDEGYSAVPFADGYLVSATQQCGSNRQARLLQLDENGDSVGVLTPLPYNGYIRPLSTGEFIFLGGNRAGLAYDTVVIAKANAQLDTVWTRPLFFPECNNQVYDLIETADGYVATGIFSETVCNMGPVYQSFAVKLDMDGQVVWQKTYGGEEDDELFAVREKANGQLWHYGWQRRNGIALPWLLITGANGDSLTSVVGNNLTDIYGYGFDLTTDDGFITIDYGDSIYARKYNASFDLIWQRSLGLPSGGIYFRAFQMRDLNYGFLACLDGPTGCNSYLWKLDTTGEVVWAKNWGGLLRTVCEPEPGQFLLTGYTNAFPILPELLVVRFDTIFDSIPDLILEPDSQLGLSIYPNPTQGNITVICSEPIESLALYAMDGRLLYQEKTLPNTSQKILLPAIPQGLYLLKVETYNGQLVFKKLQLKE